MNFLATLGEILAKVGAAIMNSAKSLRAKKAAADLPRGAEINAGMKADGDAIRERIKANGGTP